MDRKVVFNQKLLPYLLLPPQLAITIVFFFWPAGAGGLVRLPAAGRLRHPHRVRRVRELHRPVRRPALPRHHPQHAVFSRRGDRRWRWRVALLLAVLADRQIRGAGVYRTLLIWPYAIAPGDRRGAVDVPVPSQHRADRPGAERRPAIAWDYKLNGNQAMLVVILASRLEAGQLQFHLLPGRAAIHPEGGAGGRRDRRRARPCGGSGPSSSRCCRRPPSSCWWSTWSTPSSTPSASSTR